MSTQFESPLVIQQAAEAPEEQPTVLIHGAAEVQGSRKPVNWTVEVPENLTHEGLTALLPGWGGIKRSSRSERHANAIRGRATLSFDPQRQSDDIIEDFFNPQSIHVDSFDSAYRDVCQEIAVNRLIPNRKLIDTERVVLSSHSMGGYSATDWGLENPGKTEAIVYKASAGFGTVNLLKDLDPINFAKEVDDYVRSGEIDLTLTNLMRIINYYGRRPMRSLGEAKHCMTIDMREKVAMLGDLAIPTGYLAFENDSVISSKKARASAKGFVDDIQELAGLGHLAPQRHAGLVSDATWGMQLRITNSVAHLLEA